MIDYIHEKMPNYRIKPVPGNGKCIILSMQECLEMSGISDDVETISKRLNVEITSHLEFYEGFCKSNIDLKKELSNFLRDPLTYYGCDTGDFFLLALGNSYEVNIILLMSDHQRCWTVNLSNYEHKDTMYFARSLSEHIDPVVRKEHTMIKPEKESLQLACPLCHEHFKDKYTFNTN